jgi:hypothetical protein
MQLKVGLHVEQGGSHSNGELLCMAAGTWPQLLLRAHRAAHSLQQFCCGLLDNMAVASCALAEQSGWQTVLSTRLLRQRCHVV